MEDRIVEAGVRGRTASLAVSLALIVLITVLHYTTPTALPLRHEIYYRLYYIPIILIAFSFGLRGGLLAGVGISILIFPHILYDWGGITFRNINMIIEVLLYNVVGLLTGFLVSSERRRRRQLERARKRLEESLEELESRDERLREVEGRLRAQERLALMGEMAAVMAHEVRNPLGSIQGAAEILSDNTGEDGEAKKYAEILVDEVRRLDGVVTNLMESARQQEGPRAPVDVNRVLGDVVYLYSGSAAKKGIRVEERLGEGLPPVLADADLLRQVFINIFLNAVEAAGRDGSVRVSSGADGEHVEVKVSDDGEGIPGEVRDSLFDLFTTTKQGGTGIGLAISKRIIEGHGGRIGIESAEGEGTVVIVSIPAWRGESES